MDTAIKKYLICLCLETKHYCTFIHIQVQVNKNVQYTTFEFTIEFCIYTVINHRKTM